MLHYKRPTQIFRSLCLCLILLGSTQAKALGFAQSIGRMSLLDSVFVYMEKIGVKHSDIVIRQVIVETGWLKSNFLMKKNNLFGFQNRSGYLNFPNWKSSVDFYKNWQSRYYLNNSEDYYDFLLRIKYASSKKYVEYLKKIDIPEKYAHPNPFVNYCPPD